MSETQIAPSATALYFNPWDPQFRANPYPYYRPLLEGPPRVLDLFGMPAALVARYSEVRDILHDHENFSSVEPPPAPEFIAANKAFFDEFPYQPKVNMLFSDPPVHERLRRLVSRDFTPRRIRELEPRIRTIMASLLDKTAKKGELEVMSDVANVLPVMVIAEMLGVPPEMYQTFKHWSDTIIASDNTLPGMPVPQEMIAARRALDHYFSAEIERRKLKPGPDLVSALVAAHQDAEALSAAELMSFVILLLLAGNETTTNLIGNGMLALARHPEQMARLRNEPALMPKAVDEMLRYDGPVQSTVRHTKCGVSIGGVEIAPATMVFVMLAAANRDPAEFKDPERFDIAREPNNHLAFGEGIHYCIGANLARLEGAVAIGMMLERFPGLKLSDPAAKLEYKGSYFLRGLAALKMALA